MKNLVINVDEQVSEINENKFENEPPVSSPPKSEMEIIKKQQADLTFALVMKGVL
jgi:hypothetical protein